MKKPDFVIGGVNPEAAALAALLTHGGLRLNGKKPGEELVFGLSGGPAFGYFVFEYAGHDPHVYLGTRRYWHDPSAAFGRAVKTLGGELEIKSASGVSTAEKQLFDCLDSGRIAAVHVDAASLKYNQLPAMWTGAVPTVVVVHGVEDGIAYISDRAEVLIEVPLSELTAARLKQKKHKAALYSLVEVGGQDTLVQNLPTSLKEIASNALHPGLDAKGFQGNLGLAGMRKWAELAGAEKGAKCWKKVFASPCAFITGMRSLYSWIEFGGTGGGGSRRHFASFLDTSAELLNNENLHGIADEYRILADMLTGIAETALPSEIQAFEKSREAILKKEKLFRELGAGAAESIKTLNGELAAIQEEFSKSAPISEKQRVATFHKISEMVQALAESEEKALASLSQAID